MSLVPKPEIGNEKKTDSGANLSAVGTYQIDAGTVSLVAQSGGAAPVDALDGMGMNFGDYNKLPADEKAAWQKLWADVEALLKKAKSDK